MNKVINSHKHIHAIKKTKIQRKEMVALSHYSGIRLYWDSGTSPVLYIWFSEQSRVMTKRINTPQINALLLNYEDVTVCWVQATRFLTQDQ